MACNTCRARNEARQPKPEVKENIIKVNEMEYTEIKAQALEECIQLFDSLGSRNRGSRQEIDKMISIYERLFDKLIPNKNDMRAIDLVFRQLKFGVYTKYKAGEFNLVKTSPLTDGKSKETNDSTNTQQTSKSTAEPTKSSPTAKKTTRKRKSGSK